MTNMPGGSGAVAIANVITKRKGDTNLLVAASNSLTFTIAMKRTAHTYNDVIPLAQVGAEMGGFFVRADSKYKTLTDLVERPQEGPEGRHVRGRLGPGQPGPHQGRRVRQGDRRGRDQGRRTCRSRAAVRR